MGRQAVQKMMRCSHASALNGTGCDQHAQWTGRKLELCMPINEARRRSLESRGACALSDRCRETRHDWRHDWRHAHLNTFHVSRARYRCQSNVRYFHPLFHRFLASIPAHLSRPPFVQVSKYHCYPFFFPTPHPRPASTASISSGIIIAPRQPYSQSSSNNLTLR